MNNFFGPNKSYKLKQLTEEEKESFDYAMLDEITKIIRYLEEKEAENKALQASYFWKNLIIGFLFCILAGIISGYVLRLVK